MQSTVTATDFFFLGLSVHPLSPRTSVGVVNRPHLHQRAMEVFFFFDGSVEIDFLPVTISKAEVFVFPRGLVHYKRNGGEAPAAAVSELDSQLFHIELVGQALCFRNRRWLTESEVLEEMKLGLGTMHG
ncbi:hypothetical protein HPP92_009828 [Vanilla planifolia]|uniref:Cupin type-1 domain-containing protein n=1 Tax=Vanilla planifolia TaxID=51239 RepID=A0A835V7T2_VANPL|nr:hypothetical protein HPP92_010026 [Vanilla planifolia]KAG0487733.1 hypothetical protein HPP92_009828 [Vanilla planifolia]